jgi:hypothetical protein
MAVDLYPTPTRLALLREVATGEAWQKSTGHTVVEQINGRVRNVTVRIAEMQQAGWIVLTPMRFGAKRWDLTDAGTAALATNTGKG